MKRRDLIIFAMSVASLIVSIVSFAMSIIIPGGFSQIYQNAVILVTVCLLAFIAIYSMVGNYKLTDSYINKSVFANDLVRGLATAHSTGENIAKLFTALSDRRLAFSTTTLSLVKYCSSRPHALSPDSPDYINLRLLAAAVHRDRRTYLSAACNTLANVLMESKAVRGLNTIISTNVKLIINDGAHYITVMRSDRTNRLRYADDSTPLALFEHELLDMFTRAPRNKLIVNDIEEEYLSKPDRPRIYRFPNNGSPTYYRSCIIVPMRGQEPRLPTNGSTPFAPTTSTIGYVVADSPDPDVFSGGTDVYLMTQIANYIYSMYIEYWVAVEGTGESKT